MITRVIAAASGDAPLVSVIMNCFNGEKYLREAIDSVIRQTFTNWEIVFWDNQSSDNSASIADSYQDDRIKYYYAAKHTLLYEARNHAYAKARGDLIAFLDVDDIWEPEKLERQVSLFSDPRIGIACSNFWIDESASGTRKLSKKTPTVKKRTLINLLKYYDVGLLTLMVRRAAMPNKRPPFDGRFHIIGDFDLVIRLAASWELAYLPSPTATYRVHGANESLKQKDLLIAELECWVSEQRQNKTLLRHADERSLETYLNYCKAGKAILLRERVAAFSHIMKVPWCYLKLKAICGLMLPHSLIKNLF